MPSNRQRDCGNKTRYYSEGEALDQIDYLVNVKHVTAELRVYPCSWCRGFHLTSRPNDRDEDRHL